MGEGLTAALLQQRVEVDPLACPTGHGTMRVVAFITQASVIDQILTHFRTRAATAASAARSPLFARQGTGAATHPTPIEILSRRWLTFVHAPLIDMCYELPTFHFELE